MRVVAEKGLVQLPAKTVHKEVLKAFFGPDGIQAGKGVGYGNLHKAHKSKLRKSVHAQGHGIGKELPLVQDAREPVAHKEGIFVQGHILAFHGQNGLPPLHDLVGFGEKPVPAKVYAVAIVANCLGNSSSHIFLLYDKNICAAQCEQAPGSRQACRACAYDNVAFPCVETHQKEFLLATQ